MKERFCYWSVASGSYGAMMQGLVASARKAGVFKDFHVWTDRPIEGAICHPVSKLDTTGRLFQLEFIQRKVKRLRYDYFVWLDADTIFVRHPGDVLRVLAGAPIHSSLESDAASPPHLKPDWGDCSLANFTKLMKFNGVRSRSIFTVNAGFWIVHREVIDDFYWLASDFWHFANQLGYEFGFEPLLAYTTQMYCGNPYEHLLRNTADLWAVDRKGCYRGKLPDGKDWEYVDEFSGQRLRVNPAIVHAKHSKRALMAGVPKAVNQACVSSRHTSPRKERRNRTKSQSFSLRAYTDAVPPN